VRSSFQAERIGGRHAREGMKATFPHEHAPGKTRGANGSLRSGAPEVCCHRDVKRRQVQFHAVGYGGVLLRSWRLWRQQKHDNKSASVHDVQGRSASRNLHHDASDEVERVDDWAGSASRAQKLPPALASNRPGFTAAPNDERNDWLYRPALAEEPKSTRGEQEAKGGSTHDR